MHAHKGTTLSSSNFRVLDYATSTMFFSCIFGFFFPHKICTHQYSTCGCVSFKGIFSTTLPSPNSSWFNILLARFISLKHQKKCPYRFYWSHSYNIQEGYCSKIKNETVDRHLGDIYFDWQIWIPVHLDLYFFGGNLKIFIVFRFLISLKSFISYARLTDDAILMGR